MKTPPGLRERKKEATRQALHEAAVRLAVEHGPERVTVEAIADAAGVSRRTFSNYFEGKEQALLYSDQRWLRSLLELLDTRPQDEPPWQALSTTAQSLVSDRAADPRWVEQMRLLRRHPSLLREQVAIYGRAEQALSDRIENRLPDGPHRDLAGRIMAATFLSALRVAVQQWLQQPDDSLGSILRTALTLAAAGPLPTQP